MPPAPHPATARRAAGVLLHLTSLPGPHGSGDLGPAARSFVELLAAAGFSWWQILPVEPPGAGFSPYSALSSFAGSPWLISLEDLAEEGLLAEKDLEPPQKLASGPVDWAATTRFRKERLRRAFSEFVVGGGLNDPAYLSFREEQAAWVLDWSLFAALQEVHEGKPWWRWPVPLRRRGPEALAEARRELTAEAALHVWIQFTFRRQWRRLQEHAAARGVRFLGDLPFYVVREAAEVWAEPSLFRLGRATLRPDVVTGVPPDRFSATGQLWGHPHYFWPRHRSTGFRWWCARVGHVLALCDVVRLDHFLGFHQGWGVPRRATDASRGTWLPAPGHALLRSLRYHLGEPMPLVAEDLGAVTDEALQLRDTYGLPGMRVLQFAFDEEDSPHLPAHYPEHCVAYTGTHDNDTLRGWLRSLAPEARKRAREVTGARAEELAEALLEALWKSPAALAVVPLQDLLGLGSRGRMNTPGTAEGNWRWRTTEEALAELDVQALRRALEAASRL